MAQLCDRRFFKARSHGRGSCLRAAVGNRMLEGSDKEPTACPKTRPIGVDLAVSAQLGGSVTVREAWSGP